MAIPQRTCVGCRRVRPQTELIRLARRADGTLAVDRARRMPGRGAYVCPEAECLERARRRLSVALRAPLAGFEEAQRELVQAGVA